MRYFAKPLTLERLVGVSAALARGIHASGVHVDPLVLAREVRRGALHHVGAPDFFWAHSPLLSATALELCWPWSPVTDQAALGGRVPS